MKTNIKIYLPLIIGVACAVGVVIGSYFNFPRGERRLVASSNTSKQKLGRLIDFIDYDYVDRVNTDSIVDVTIRNILSGLDPHSTYVSKSNYQTSTENLEGDFVGIGIQFFQVDDTIAVIRTLEEGPSKKLGILPGDRLLYADDIPLFGGQFNLDSLKDILQGNPDSNVNLKIKRREKEDLLDIKITRAHIPLKSVEASFLLTKGLGYIKLNRFTKNTYSEFKAAINKLENAGVKDIVLDLRDNGGGYLKEAIKVADEFLPDGALILKTKNKSGNIKGSYATEEGNFQDSKVYVLINENSASASEIVAGALQDNDVGTIIGQRSFGKGLVQREMELGDGSAVRLTVARYYTPTGRSIQRPYKNISRQEYYSDYVKRYHNGELANKDSIHVNDSLKYVTPGGKIVYGGGGIIPDVFVPRDVNYKKESLDYMFKGGVMDRFIFNKMDENREYYNRLTKEKFENQEIVPDSWVDDFMLYLSEYHLNFKIEKYRSLIQYYLKATMAHQLFGTEVYDEILSKEDRIIQQVLTIYEADTE